MKPHEQRGLIIQQFMTHWRNEIGNDFYPALRLIIPEKDRDRAMYGLKEKAIAKLLIKTLKIGAKSDDGLALTEWKMPGQASKTAGDFPSRCHEVLQKRAMRSGVGDMSIAEVNILLDKLSDEQKEEGQLPIFETFYNRMNADEITWLIRIILRQMKLGASEKTILDKWHPDGEALFSVSSSLRRVCWELLDPTDLQTDDKRNHVELMACFQPQLAQFQMRTFKTTLEKLGCTDKYPEYWIEEKLDGERMQLHMQEDPSHPGGKRFRFWSRKAKDYTYLYGDGFEDEGSALTRHLKDAFHDGVDNIILDGEMITWDPETNKMLPFGTLKSAAKSEQNYENGARPLYRVFDCLLLNDQALVQYPLKDRREALNKTVKDVYQRMEKHHYDEGDECRCH
jgi:DNA ligase-4